MTWLRLTDMTTDRMRRVNSDQITDYSPMASGKGCTIWLASMDPHNGAYDARVLHVEEDAEVIDRMINPWMHPKRDSAAIGREIPNTPIP